VLISLREGGSGGPVDKENDIDLFRQEVGDVQPLRQPDRATLKIVLEDTPGQLYRRRVAEQDTFNKYCLSSDFAEPLDADDILCFKRDGVQHGVFRKLKLGAYSVDATLDLHRLNVEKARDEVMQFLYECRKFDVRTALICHGKGRRSETYPVIKSFLAKWLPAIPEIIAFHSARSFHGGTGAVYVLFRKSHRQKDINRRRYCGTR
jgi:DNA-nicking Smr family endonuclease